MLNDDWLYGHANHLNLDASTFQETYIDRFAEFFIKPGDTVIDIGVNHGQHIFHFSELVTNSGKVIGFEASDNLVNHVREIIESREIKNINIFKEVLSDKIGNEVVFQNIENADGLSGIAPHNVPEWGTIIYEQRSTNTLDEVLGELGGVSFIKADIEGGEFHAFLGGRDLIERNRPVILFENGLENTAKLYDYSLSDLFEYFDEIEYMLYDLAGIPISRSGSVWTQGCFNFLLLPNEKRDILHKMPLNIFE